MHPHIFWDIDAAAACCRTPHAACGTACRIANLGEQLARQKQQPVVSSQSSTGKQ
jgi:hypothetical protein